MRILFITEQFPYPLHDGGNLRTYHILRSLAEEHEVWLVAHGTRESEEAGIAFLGNLCRIKVVAEPPVWRRVLGNVARHGIRSHPLFLVKNWSNAILRAADSLLDAHRFDAIHFNQLDTACFALARGWSQAKVFDTHNCLSLLAGRLSDNASGWFKRAVFAREAAKLRHVECEVCRRMDLSLVCSAEDENAFKSILDSGRYAVVPNGVDGSYYHHENDSSQEPGNIVFVGAMGYYPNEEAAIFFCREVMPLLADVRPPIRLFLVGQRPSARVRALHNGISVVVTGRVEDVRPYLARAQAVVVPLLTGGGTRLKILEAFAMGKAVVSTPQGAEGIPAADGKQILLASDPQSFAQAIRRVIASEALRSSLGQEACEFVREVYDWNCVSKLLLQFYRQIFAGGLRKLNSGAQGGGPHEACSGMGVE
jgi:sugar transferase (PEP-CTERM/EpsH1 system associated)